jgi:hypothetical protein
VLDRDPDGDGMATKAVRPEPVQPADAAAIPTATASASCEFCAGITKGTHALPRQRRQQLLPDRSVSPTGILPTTVVTRFRRQRPDLVRRLPIPAPVAHLIADGRFAAFSTVIPDQPSPIA